MISKINGLLRSKKISSTEITLKYLDAIEAEDKTLNAYMEVTREEALAAAARADAKIARGDEPGLLEGVPMNLKDNISTKGIGTTCSSRILEGYKPIYDATAWRLLRQIGAVLLGKTNMDEFGMGSSTQTSCRGATRNPHDTTKVAGGSSGGLAASVAGGLAAYGLGSDTGGSVRQPASFCGAVGLKPTYGAVSRYGLVAYASSLDQIGCVTADVEDAATVFDAIAQYDDHDSTSVAIPGGRLTAGRLKDDIKGLRVGIPDEYFEGIRDDIKTAVMAAAKVFEDAGARVVPVKLAAVQYALPVYYILSCAEASSNLARYDGIRYGRRTAEPYRDVDEMICRTRDEGFGDEVKRRIMLGTYVLSSGYYDAYYRKAQDLRAVIAADFMRAFGEADLLLTPTVPTTAFGLDYAPEDPTEIYMTDICTVPVNIAGLPALSVPCGFDAAGLPIGMQLIGAHFGEGTLLNAAWQYEQRERARMYRPAGMGVAL